MASFNQMMDRGAKFGKEVVDDVMHSGFMKNIVPGKAAFADEMTSFINSNEAVKFRIKQFRIKQEDIVSGINTKLKSMQGSLGLTDEAVNGMQGIFAKGVGDAQFEAFQKALEKESVNHETAQKVTSAMKKQSSEALKESIDTSDLHGLQKITTPIQTYFGHPDKKVRNTRIVAAAGTYAGVAVGERYLSGGTLTTDSYGQKDIAGVPFI